MKLWLPAWITPRFLWTLAGVALLLACAPGSWIFVPLAALLGIALLVVTIADAMLGPRAQEVGIARAPADHFALAVPAQLAYTVENRSRRAIRIGIIEAPVRTLRFDLDELAGDVPPRSRVAPVRPVTPVARGADELGTLYVWYENSLGLLRRRLRIPAAQTIRVFPDLSAVERYGALHVRNRTIEAGLRRLRLRGAGTEFAHYPYLEVSLS